MGKHSAPNVAQHWPSVLGLRDDGTPYIAHACESGCGLAGPRSKTVLVARCGGDRRRGADCDLLILHSDDGLAAGHRGLARGGGPGSPVTMAASGLRASCSHFGGVAGSPEGVIVAR